MEYKRLMQIFLPAICFLLVSMVCYADVIQASDNKSGQAPVLLWLAVKQEGAMDFITSGSQDPLVSKINSLANNHGVSVVWPLVDLSERLFVSEHNITSLNTQQLQQIAERYNTGVILAGNIQQVADGWQCDCRLLNNAKNLLWQNSASSLDEILDLVTSTLANKLAAKNIATKQNTAKGQPMAVLVKDIHSVADYAKVLEYLKTLDIAQQVAIESVDGDRVLFIITSKCSKEDLIQAIKINDSVSLELISQGTDGDAILKYRKSL